MRRLLPLALLGATLLSACANEMPMDPMDPMDPRLMNARLEIVGASAVNVEYDGIVDLTVRYVEEDGTPIDAAAIDFEIVGDANGSRLGATQTVTDLDGVAVMSLSAGSMAASFDVTVSPPVGEDVHFDVAVAGDDAGSLTVNMTYGGTRTLVRFDAHLFDGETCATMDPEMLPVPLRSAPSTSMLSARPGFAGLSAGDTYAVAVVARSATHLAAFGCVDGVTVQPRVDTEVNVTLADQAIPPSFDGTWNLDNRFDFGGALPPSVEAVLDVLGEIGDDDATDASGTPDYEIADLDGDGRFPEYGVDPGAFVSELAMQQTCHWECLAGEEYADCSQLDHSTGDLKHIYEQDFTGWDGAQSRFFGGCGAWEFVVADAQNLVNAQVARVLPDFAVAWSQLASDLARAITNAHILSELNISAPGSNEFEVPITHELVTMVVDYRNPRSDPPGMMETASFLLADAGFASLMIDEISTVDGTTLTIPSHSFTLNWGELTLYIYREVLLPAIFGVHSTGELLATWVDCNQIAIWLEAEIDDLIWPLSGPSAATLEGYCNDGLNSAGSRIEDDLRGRIDVDGTLTIEGSATGSDIDEDTGRVGLLVDGVWSGTLTEEMMSAPVTGSFTGAR